MSVGSLRRLVSLRRISFPASKTKPGFVARLKTVAALPFTSMTRVVATIKTDANLLNNGMEQYFVFQNAFNKDYIQVLDLYVYNIGMTGNNLSMATAIGMLKSLISVILLFTVNGIAKRVRGESIV